MRPVSPIVGIVCDSRKIGDHAFHMVGEKYIAAVREGSGALPLLIPALIATARQSNTTHQRSRKYKR